MFEHKGYQGAITTVDSEAGIFHGNVIGIQDVITFEGKTVSGLAKAFRDSVDDYLEFCAQRKEAPEKPYSGRFVVRLAPEMHRLACEAAGREQSSLNSWIISAIEARLDQAPAGSGGLSFSELEQVASCVAAMIAEKQRRPNSGNLHPESARRRNASGTRRRTVVTE